MFWLLIAVAGSLAGLGAFNVYKTAASNVPVDLDKTLPQPAVSQICSAIVSPASTVQSLLALASQYQGYPYAVLALQTQAWKLAGKQGPAPVFGQPLMLPPGPATQTGQMAFRPGVRVGPPRVARGPAAPGPAAPVGVGALGDMGALASQAAVSASAFFNPQGTAPTSSPTPAGGPPPAPVGIIPGNGAGMSAGPGWLMFPVSSAASFTWVTAEIPDVVGAECARLGKAGLYGEVVSQGPDGAVWKFQGADGVVVASKGVPAAVAAPPASAENSEGVGAGAVAVQAGQINDPMAHVAPYMTEAQEEVGAKPAVAAAATPGHVVVYRASDKAFPRTIATVGSGVHNLPGPVLAHLGDINPHLAKNGVIRGFKPGDRINVPDEWVANLKAKGFQVESSVS